MLWNRSWLLAGHPCLFLKYLAGFSWFVGRNIARHAWVFAAQYAKFKGMATATLSKMQGFFFRMVEKQPQHAEGYLSLHVISECLGFLLGPSDLVVVTKRRDFLSISLVQLPPNQALELQVAVRLFIVHGACLEDHSRGRLPCSRSKAGNPWISNGSNSLKPKNPHCFTGSFAQRLRGVFLSKNPLVSTTGWPRNA